MCKAVYGSITQAWFNGRTAGRQLRGIASNPHPVGSKQSDQWEDGYKCGRNEREGK